MNSLFFTDRHYNLLENLKLFLKEELEPIKSNFSNMNKVPPLLIRKLGKQGYLGPLIDTQYSGSNLGMVSHCLITEELSKVNVAVSVTRTPCILDGYLLNRYGNEKQKEKFLPKIAMGEKLCSICVTEDQAGSNVAGIKTRAEKSGGEYILNGSKKFITNAGIADYYFIWAITDDKINARNGMSVFLVEKDSKGLKIEHPYELMGINGIHNGVLNIDDLVVPEDNLIGKEGSGFYSLMDTFNVERITLSSECNGISLAALEAAKNYAVNRVQFNKTISNFQIIKLKIAYMATHLQAARLLTYNAAKLFEYNYDVTKEASMAKAFSSKAALNITSEALQIHGGDGYTTAYDAERYMREARFYQIGGGTTEIQNLIIAREELKQ